MFVLDSSALIEVLQNGRRADKIISLVGDAPLVTVSVCAHEVLAGALKEKDRFVLEAILSSAEVLPHSLEAAKIGARLEEECGKAGNTVNRADVLIAAVCKEHGATIVTLDKDFSRIKGAKVRVL